MQRSNLSIKSLEVFREVASSGHVQTAARDTGLSISTVSHHLGKLESALGVTLLDHSRRPMVLTSEGRAFLTYVEQALTLLRKAEGDALSGRLSDVRNLRLALIEDFDSRIAPELANVLARAMPSCSFVHLTRPSHEILSLIATRSVDVGLATQPQFEADGLVAHPLLRDPFVMALPKEDDGDPDAYLAGQSPLPFLCYSDDQIIGKQIRSHLQRLRINLPQRFQFESNQSLMGMIADGSGWAITTPTNYLRAGNFSHRINLLPLPAKKFARQISLFAQPDFSPGTTRLIWKTMRSLIGSHAVEPALSAMPWLEGEFSLLNSPDFS